MSNVPAIGDKLTVEEIVYILESFHYRQRNFPGESEDTSLSVVLLNIGDSFTPVQCVKGEWRGLKRDIIQAGALPLCPNGHVMFEGSGMRLGWIADD